jgi:parallel beta-helix repeat protein
VEVAPTTVATDTDYYVDGQTGSDSNPGTVDQPWQTIQKAADVMGPGDTCVVRTGEYSERVRVEGSGAPGAPVRFEADGSVVMEGFTVNGDYIVIKGFTVTSKVCDWKNGSGIYMSGSHCVLEENYLYYNPKIGIIMDRSSTNCIVRDNRMQKNATAGLYLGGADHLVEGNEIWESIEYHPDTGCGTEDSADADGIRFFGSGHIIRRNHIHDITYDDPLVDDAHIDCFQTWGNADSGGPGRETIFEQNLCEVLTTQGPNENGHGFMLEEASDLIIRNNIIKAFAGINTGPGGNEGLTIANNLFVSDLSFGSGAGIGLRDAPNVIAKNNVFFDQPGPAISRAGNVEGHEIGYNLVYRSDGQEPSGSPYPNDLWDVDPRFVDPRGGDYHLQSGSPCIDAGVALSQVADDFDGNARPQGAGIDIGPYEHAGGELVIDDRDVGFSTYASQDEWQKYVEPGGEHYGNSHHYNRQMGSGEDIGTWSFRVPRPGVYEVYAWWYGESWRPNDVPYTVYHLDGPTTVRVNQQVDGGQWNLLGTFGFLGWGSVTVSDDVSVGRDVVADAIRLVYQRFLPEGVFERVFLPVLMH